MTTAPGVTLADLRAIDLLDGLSDQEVGAWRAAAVMRDLSPGEIAVEHGARADLLLLVEGRLEATLPHGELFEPVGTHEAPTWVGAIAALTGERSAVRMQAVVASRVAVITSADLLDLVFAQRSVHQRIMRQVLPVANRITAANQRRERLTALGTMAAGLAHELNNPAAAVQRAAADLAIALQVIGSTLHHFVEAGVEREDAARLAALQSEAVKRASERGVLDALDASDREDELLVLLEAHDVPGAWRLAEPLALAGVDEAWLLEVIDRAGAATSAALEYVAASLIAQSLAEEVRESAERMSKLVGAVKGYAYMDRGELVEVDVHEGLETTLVVLGHKLKRASIDVIRDYDRELPKVTVHGAELNQVWTNLLDNAVDALEERDEPRTITLSTRRDGDCIEIRVADDGPGVPAEILSRVFDPFFTTKAVGAGTGMGLDSARRVVVEQHRGSLQLDSVPGRTVFTVLLPLT